nr:immunoglobulin heavy chain junction region [Macaca mulatta]MOV54109.1 immunoglobulin heavy chain junction region [Macaca mulatta]MOV56157.1 immunoglobulin heavy chain junction region [Macaca mulatta]MOV57420.1 immunoglobulin heavy chain junction region [Macaca mulatta]MOV57626.1 immunoglobulin heavy chain junction region [Macaca mulatta]
CARRGTLGYCNGGVCYLFDSW